MLRVFTFLFLSAITALAGTLNKSPSDGTPVRVEPGGFFLTFPTGWTLLRPAAASDYPTNVCFPRFAGSSGYVDCVLVRPKPTTLAEAVSSYIGRETSRDQPNQQIVELERAPFSTRSGVSGIRVVLDRQSSARGTHRLYRYFFPLPGGEFVCLGAFGSPSIHNIILDALQLR